MQDNLFNELHDLESLKIIEGPMKSLNISKKKENILFQKRKFETIFENNDKKPQEEKLFSSVCRTSDTEFTVLTYNVLCSNYCSKSQFPYCPNKYLKWDYRKKLLLQELLHYNVDIICLQEVNHFPFISKVLKAHGYTGIQKTRLKHPDSSCIFYKENKFKLLGKAEINFDDLGADVVQPGEMKNQPSQQTEPLTTESSNSSCTSLSNDDLRKDNVGLVLHLGFGPFSIFVATCHLHWNPLFENVKLVQAKYLLSQIKVFISKQNLLLQELGSLVSLPRLVVTGDFNSLPSSDAYKFVIANSNDLKSIFQEQEPKFTNYTKGFEGTLDYILFSPKTLTLTRRLQSDISKLVLENGKYFPNENFPSDHIPLAAAFYCNSLEE